MEIENKSEKEAKEKVKSENTEEIITKNQISKSALAGLITSGIGGGLYLLIAFITRGNIWLIIPCLIAGVISVTGIIIGRYKTKIGGLILLLPLPIAIYLGSILTSQLSIWTFYPMIGIVFPIGLLVIIGAIVLIASKKV